MGSEMCIRDSVRSELGEEEGVLNPLDIISKTQVDTVPPSQVLGWTHGTSD